MINNVYIHIPFCRQQCNYCSFVSFPHPEKIPEYIFALKNEINYFYKGEILNTLYFGGGTPSLLRIEDFKEITDLLNVAESTEFTVEVNPETVDKNYLEGLKNLGVNRLSFGCQTFNKEILQIIGRKHSPQQVAECVQNAQDVGFENISLDFIYGLPSQTIEDFEADLNKAVTLGIRHVSLYGLKIDKGCYFYSHMPENLPDDDAQADMYLKAIEILTNNNFVHYEISNFSVVGFESKHNLNYWNNNSYYGFGVAAHGYNGVSRYSNKLKLDDYIKNPVEHAGDIILTEREKMEEEIFLGFRKLSGINVEEINKKYSIDFEKIYKDVLDKYISYGYLVKSSCGYKLTDAGILVSNVILADFI